MVAWVAASGGIAEDVRLRKRASRSLTKTGFWERLFCVAGTVLWRGLPSFWEARGLLAGYSANLASQDAVSGG